MIFTAATTSNLPANPSNNDVCIILGHSVKGDGGGGQLFWDETLPLAPVDNGLIFQGTTNNGRWKRIFDGTINVKWFGAKGDDVTDDTAAINNASLKKQGLYFPPGKYKISGTIDIDMADCAIIGNNAVLKPVSSITAINLRGTSINYSGLSISFVGAGTINQSAVAIRFFPPKPNTTNNQVNNSILSNFRIEFAHTGIKALSGEGAVWQTEISNVYMNINSGNSLIKAIGIDLGNPATGTDNTTLTIKKVSIQDFTGRSNPVTIRGISIIGYTDLKIEGVSCDGLKVENAGELMYIVANQIEITGSYHEKINNTLNLLDSDSAPIMIIGRNTDSTVHIHDLIFLKGVFNCGGSGAVGTWICFRNNPYVSIGNINNLLTTNDGCVTTNIDFSLYRGYLNSYGNLRYSDIAFYERNAKNTSLDSDLSFSNSLSNVPRTLTSIYTLPVNTYAYLFCIKGYYSTDSNISFFDVVSIDSSYNGTKTVLIVSSNKTGYPFNNTYSINGGNLYLTRSGGSAMTIICKIIAKQGVG